MFIRMELRVPRLGKNEKNVYDCLVETANDFLSTKGSMADECGQGSLAYCLEDGKVYCKDSAGDWNEVEQG